MSPHPLLSHPTALMSEQALPGQRSVTTTMTYSHVLNRGGMGVHSSADGLDLSDLARLPAWVPGSIVEAAYPVVRDFPLRIQYSFGRKRVGQFRGSATAYYASSDWGSTVAKLRVGDIMIDGAHVRVGASPSGANSPTPTGIAVSSPMATWIATKVRRRSLLAVGASTTVGGLALLFWLGSGEDPIRSLLAGGVVASVGLGCFFLGLVHPLLVRTIRAERRAIVAPAVRRISEVLSPPAPHQTVEWIVQRTKLAESDVVLALIEMRNHGLVEDLDMTSGHFYYGLSDPPRVGGESLESRLRRLTNEETT